MADQNSKTVSINKRINDTMDSVPEMAVLADAMYQMGYIASAFSYAAKGINAIKNGAVAGSIPDILLKSYNVSNPGALFAGMWLKFVPFSVICDISGSAEIVLKFWLENEPDNPEALFQYGLNQAMKRTDAGDRFPREIPDELRRAHKMMRNDRSGSAMILAEGCPNQDIPLPYDGAYIFVYPTLQNLTTYVLLERHDWFEGAIHLFRKLVLPGSYVLDIGANVGVYALSAARRVGASGKVLAVEPHSYTYYLLRKTALAFNNMKAIHIALSEYSGSGYLELDSHPENNRLQRNSTQGEPVNIMSVDSLAENEGINRFDLIKIDAEGEEIPIIRGAKKIIAENDPIIFYEVKEEFNWYFERIEMFRNLGYDSYYYCAQRNVLIRYNMGDGLESSQLNMIAIRPESLKRVMAVAQVE